MSMYMGWKEQQNFIRDALGPAFADAGIKTKILVFDHNYNYDDIADQKSYPLNIYGDPDASRYIAGSAWHNYGGKVSELATIANKAPDKEICFCAVTLSSNTKKVTSRQSHYYNIAHASKVIRPGAVRISATGYSQSGLQYQVFLNPDNTYGAILCNEGEAVVVVFKDGTHSVKVEVPSKALVSVAW